MLLEEESEIVENEDDLFSSANRPKEARLSNNCLVSDKGHIKQNDLTSFSNIIFKNSNETTNISKFTKIRGDTKLKSDFRNNSLSEPKSYECIVVQKLEDDSEVFIEVKPCPSRRVRTMKRMYIGQRKLSSTIILADMLK